MDINFEIKKRELLNELYTEVGAALMDCQGFEYGIALLLHILAFLGVKGLDCKNTSQILSNESKKTAGQLKHMLKKHIQISDTMETKLTKALDARNILVHRILIDNIEKIPNKNSRDQLIHKIRELRSIVKDGDHHIRQFVNYLGKETTGFDESKFSEKIRGSIC